MSSKKYTVPPIAGFYWAMLKEDDFLGAHVVSARFKGNGLELEGSAADMEELDAFVGFIGPLQPGRGEPVCTPRKNGFYWSRRLDETNSTDLNIIVQVQFSQEIRQFVIVEAIGPHGLDSGEDAKNDEFEDYIGFLGPIPVPAEFKPVVAAKAAS